MSPAQPEPRLADETAPEPNDEPRTPAATLGPARMLANPRRVRRA